MQDASSNDGDLLPEVISSLKHVKKFDSEMNKLLKDSAERRAKLPGVSIDEAKQPDYTCRCGFIKYRYCAYLFFYVLLATELVAYLYMPGSLEFTSEQSVYMA